MSNEKFTQRQIALVEAGYNLKLTGRNIADMTGLTRFQVKDIAHRKGFSRRQNDPVTNQVRRISLRDFYHQQGWKFGRPYHADS